MKKNQLVLMASVFISGIILGVAIPGLLSCGRHEIAPVPLSLTQIDTTTANTLFRQYYDKATIETKPFKGFSLEMEQLGALNKLFNGNGNLKGFRLYMGPDTPERIRIIVGIDKNGNDDVKCIYKTNIGTADPCPPICDGNSPITRKTL